MVHQIEVHGEQVILGGNGALVASQSQPGYWHTIRPQHSALVCDCKGYQHRGRCRHVDAVKLVIQTAEAKQKKQAEQAKVAEVKAQPVAPADDRDTAILAGPAIDPPLFPESKPYVQPKVKKTFEEMFPEYAA